MKHFVLSALFCFIALACVSFAEGLPDVEKHPTCMFCGMDRGKFAHSRMLIEYDDGTSFGACSLHCVAVDLASNIDKTPGTIGVADYKSKKMVGAEKAFWVLGGKKPGVMTSHAKWAFGSKPDAENFVKENGGVLATFDEAMKAAYDDMYQDTRQIREKRRMKRALKLKGQRND